MNLKEFEQECGVGIVITIEEIQKTVNEMFEDRNEELHRLRYTINIGEYMAKLKEKLPFADGALLNKEFNDLLLKKLGPQTEEDVKMKEKAKRKPE